MKRKIGFGEKYEDEAAATHVCEHCKPKSYASMYVRAVIRVATFSTAVYFTMRGMINVIEKIAKVIKTKKEADEFDFSSINPNARKGMDGAVAKTAEREKSSESNN